MFHGVSDVVAYRRSSISSWSDDEYLSSGPFQALHDKSFSLPIELEPPYSVPEPWPSDSACIDSDFILVAEFCEIKGPKPLISIPSHLNCALDLNTFAVRILSVDYQGVESGSCIPVEDTQAFLPDVYPGVHAYVHYMTLSDMSARGYVRPMCLAYVTVDKLKLINHFQSIRNQFAIASSHMKYGSRTLFRKELEHRLQDLLYTKGCYITHSTKSPTTETPPELPNDEGILLNTITLESLQSSIEEAERALSKVKQLVNEESINDDQLNSFQVVLNSMPHKFVKSYLAITESSSQSSVQHTPCLINPSSESYDGPLRNIFSLSGKHAAVGLFLLFKTFKVYSIDSLELHMKTHHTVLPHMEQAPSNLFPSAAHTVCTNFWESIKCHSLSADYESSSEHSSSFSSEISDSVSLNRTSDSTSVSFSSSLEYLNSNLFSTIHSLNENSLGYGIAEVFSLFPCAQHVLYSLLMSRLLVIVGSAYSELRVRKTVKALQPLIIPFTCPALVIPWRKESLKMTDLGWVQLVGLCHSSNQCLASIIPDSMKHYISILDVDKHIFVGPAYSGTFLNIFDIEMKNIDDVSLLSLINSVIFDIVLKTRIYYYHQLEAESSIQYERSQSTEEDNDKLFFRQMPNSASDISIIKHLVEVMKTEIINKLKSRSSSIKNDGSKTAPVVRIRHEPVSVIKL